MNKIVSDELGPENIVKAYMGLRGVLVIGNTVLGSGKGGTRMTPDVTEEKVARLPRTMTLKNTLAGILFVANAGGVISSYAEYRGYNPKQMFQTVKNKIVTTANLVMQRSVKKGINPRKVALEPAQKRILERNHNIK